MTVLHGDCLEVMPTLDAESFDAIITDPPYHLTTGKKGGSGPASVNLESPYGRARIGTGFMGKAWDGGDVAFRAETWAEVLRVAKPGAYLLAFGGTRTYHRLTVAIEDAGWEIRDCLSWLYGSGFPKSHNGPWGGTALKPAWEPIILARKPLVGTVAKNVEQHGTGGLNIDGCRLAPLTDEEVARSGKSGGIFSREGSAGIDWKRDGGNEKGRWPANVVLDEEAARLLDEQSGTLQSGHAHVLKRGETTGKGMGFGSSAVGHAVDATYGDSGGASRFFFVARGECKCERANIAVARSSQPSQAADSAPSVAAIARGPSDLFDRGPASIESSPDSTQPPNPAPSAASPASTDTTPTTPTYCGSCGCALPVTDGSTNPASAARVAGGNGLAAGTRFWYSAKASRAERNAGLGGFEERPAAVGDVRPSGDFGERLGPRADGSERKAVVHRNHHPTVKPLDLMQWLCRLVTPKGGLILDPFCGSGTTGRAAVAEGFRFVGIEKEAEYVEIARARIAEYAPLFNEGGAA